MVKSELLSSSFQVSNGMPSSFETAFCASSIVQLQFNLNDDVLLSTLVELYLIPKYLANITRSKL